MHQIVLYCLRIHATSFKKVRIIIKVITFVTTCSHDELSYNCCPSMPPLPQSKLDLKNFINIALKQSQLQILLWWRSSRKNTLIFSSYYFSYIKRVRIGSSSQGALNPLKYWKNDKYLTHITTLPTDSIFNALGPSRFIKKEKKKIKE